MKLAILFWFYKEIDVCENRLEILKRYNPDCKIFGLFGGERRDAKRFRSRFGKYLDDFYIARDHSPSWKWIHGDLLLLEWFQDRGRSLKWDSIAVVQWDMLVFASLKELFSGMKKGAIYLSGLSRLTRAIENRWHWTTPSNPRERRRFVTFRNCLREKFGYTGYIDVCLFTFEIFPRVFFSKFSKLKDPVSGMLEYKIPMYARIFNIPFYKKDLGVWWYQKRKVQLPLNAVPEVIPTNFIESEMKKKKGWRIFHPYFKVWKEF